MSFSKIVWMQWIINADDSSTEKHIIRYQKQHLHRAIKTGVVAFYLQQDQSKMGFLLFILRCRSSKMASCISITFDLLCVHTLNSCCKKEFKWQNLRKPSFCHKTQEVPLCHFIWRKSSLALHQASLSRWKKWTARHGENVFWLWNKTFRELLFHWFNRSGGPGSKAEIVDDLTLTNPLLHTNLRYIPIYFSVREKDLHSAFSETWKTFSQW